MKDFDLIFWIYHFLKKQQKSNDSFLAIFRCFSRLFILELIFSICTKFAFTFAVNLLSTQRYGDLKLRFPEQINSSECVYALIFLDTEQNIQPKSAKKKHTMCGVCVSKSNWIQTFTTKKLDSESQIRRDFLLVSIVNCLWIIKSENISFLRNHTIWKKLSFWSLANEFLISRRNTPILDFLSKNITEILQFALNRIYW